MTEPVIDDESATSELSIESVVSKNIITQFERNQGPAVQLCNVRAHNRVQKDSGRLFGLLAGGERVAASRPHAYSMQQVTMSDLKSSTNLNRMGSTKGSPALQPTPSRFMTT